MSIVSRVKSRISGQLPRVASFAGSRGKVVFFGEAERAPSMADFFCGQDTGSTGVERLRRATIPGRARALAASGTTAIFCPGRGESPLSELEGEAIRIPLRVELKKTLPATDADLMAGVKNSTTREDLRRIRKAGFTYRITDDPEDIRTFHDRFYVPLVNQQFPEDGTILSLNDMLNGGGEIVCAELDGEWVAGIRNTRGGDNYAMAQLGIRDADEEVRRSRVVSALLVRSMQRAVELQLQTTTLGFSLPFLGKGPIWFKAKWGCDLVYKPQWPSAQVLLDLTQESARQTLADCPILHLEGDALVASSWLEPGDAPLKALAREAERYRGLARWYMFGTAETLASASDVLQQNDRVIPVPIDPAAKGPLWLGSRVAHSE